MTIRLPALPIPDRTEQLHSENVAAKIRQHIEHNGGDLGFSHFMNLALYAPGLGYYSAGKWKFGEQGDFTTAPELGELFGACVANQCRDLLVELTQGVIVEFGAGTGALCSQILSRLADYGVLPDTYYIVELSGELRHRQEQKISELGADLAARVVWIDRIDEFSFDGIVIANEVLDAMPVDRFEVVRDGYLLSAVGVDSNEFSWQSTRRKTDDSDISNLIARYNLPTGFVSEHNLRATALVRSLGSCLSKGMLLLIDYGYSGQEYYHPQRNKGTLRCHYRHHAHDDPLILPGLQDITAHVNFTAIAEAGLQVGLELMGFVNQAEFLINSGLMEELQKQTTLDAKAQLKIANQVKMLTLPDKMGEVFKVMALSKGLEHGARGFSRGDRRHTLQLAS
jgi:SAM-dependent MidA family methyltransferase